MEIRVGFGFDVHRLEAGNDFFLGGIKIEHNKGTIGHSDADVLIHAICDALLGAANLHDIGFHFPDNDPSLKNIDSKILLSRVVTLIAEKGFSIGNIDSTISLQKPKIIKYISSMKTTLASVMQIGVEQISIKATTTEKLGFEGREEGISAYVVALINKKF